MSIRSTAALIIARSSKLSKVGKGHRARKRRARSSCAFDSSKFGGSGVKFARLIAYLGPKKYIGPCLVYGTFNTCPVAIFYLTYTLRTLSISQAYVRRIARAPW